MKKTKIGILGGGQLGKMLCEAASPLDLDIHILDQSIEMSAGKICRNFTEGDFNNFDDVVAFGEDKDVITIEIESVNHKALAHLEKLGKKVYPQSRNIALIKDKGAQKTFYQENEIPTSPFSLFTNAEEIIAAVDAGDVTIPFVQKARTGGYDGRGVQIVKTKEDLKKLLHVPSLVEEKVDIHTEISVIVARSPSGDMASFPVVEMEFHPTANLVEYLSCPSLLSESIQQKAKEVAESIASKLEIVGLLAVELFYDNRGDILVNEVAPRPHNSGHHSIEGNITSQFQQHLRAILDLPLGDTSLIKPSVMINILGEEGFTGDAIYENIEECLQLSGVYIHLYGKSVTKPYRKMGHATITSDTLEEAIEKAKFVKRTLKVKA